MNAHLCDDLPNLSEIRTASEPTPREEVLDEARADVVAHLVQLLVDLGIVLVVLDELHDQRAVRQRKELCVLSLSTSGSLHPKMRSRRAAGPTIFSVRPFHRSSPMALYCLLVVAIPDR